jgi:SAM-dependent methyltransferase
MGIDFYTEGGYARLHPTFHTEDSPWKAGQILTMFRRNGIDPGTICEIGCGAGEVLRQIHDSLGSGIFVGYEISPQAFELCRQRETERLRFVLGDGTDERSDEFFDVVLVIDVVEHVEDYLGFLRMVRNRGSLKVFHVPLDASALTILVGNTFDYARQHVGHIHFFSREIFFSALRHAGYDILDWAYTPAGFIAPPGSRKERVLRRARALLFPAHQDITVRALGGYSLLILAR